jgi:hypothetical protein
MMMRRSPLLARLACLACLALLVLVALVAPASVASAQPAADARVEAAKRFRGAREAFVRGDFAAAAAAFESAAQLVPHPATFLDAAEAWERAAEPVKSAIACDAVLANPHVEPRYRDAAEAILRRVGSRVATLDLTGPASLDVRVDGMEIVLPARRRLAPGAHEVLVVDGDARSVEPISLAPGSSSSLVLRRPEAPGPRASAAKEAAPVAAPREAPRDALPEPSAAPAGRHGPPALSWIAFGAAGVSAGVAGYFGVAATEGKSAYEAAPSVDRRDTFYRDRTVTNVALASAVGFAVLGTVVWLVTPRSEAAHLARSGAGGIAF